MQRYYSKIQSLSKLKHEARPRICKSIVVVCEMAACIMIATSLQNCDCINDFTELINRWCYIMLTLKESDLKSNMNNICLKTMIRKFINMAPTAQHLYLIYDILLKIVSKYIFKLLNNYIYSSR